MQCLEIYIDLRVALVSPLSKFNRILEHCERADQGSRTLDSRPYAVSVQVHARRSDRYRCGGSLGVAGRDLVLLASGPILARGAQRSVSITLTPAISGNSRTNQRGEWSDRARVGSDASVPLH